VNSSIPDEKLPGVVLGRDRTISRVRALAELAASDRQDREQLLTAVLENTYEPRRYRTVAAIALGRVATSAAEEILLRNAAKTDDDVFPDVLRSLGRIGGRSARDAIEALKLPASHPGARAAAFATTLIAHRLGLPDYARPIPEERDLLPRPGKDVRRVEYSPAEAAVAQAVVADLTRQPYGIACDPATLTRLECAGQVTLVCPNREFVGPGAERLTERPAVVALAVLQSPETGEYSVSHMILSRPSGEGSVTLTIHRPSGRLVLAGTGRVQDTRIAFDFRAVQRPGARAVSLIGTMQAGRLHFSEALVSTTREKARVPARYVAPSTTVALSDRASVDASTKGVTRGER
jgi:hypothetical protein